MSQKDRDALFCRYIYVLTASAALYVVPILKEGDLLGQPLVAESLERDGKARGAAVGKAGVYFLPEAGSLKPQQ
ncbi:hypothetical protein GsuE55_35310 [Geobacillus subterraneus]|uniref:Uncharacterized protein n=1 Tax=Geobacillus subterraneus TaxID=129338 RepID=A0A679FQ96_9BACL|nr:hypothetical protein GsuE55_35310 [Geobacillus subterraneus]